MSAEPPPKSPGARRLRALLALAAVGLLALVGGIALGPRRFGGEDLGSGERFGLVLVWYIDLTITAAIAFVLLRSLIKLYFERKSRTPGSRFRVRLVATHVGLALLPTLLVFLIASNLLRQSIDRWFSPGFEKALTDARALSESLVERETARAGASAEEVARELPASDSDLDSARRRSSLDLVALLRNGRVAAVSRSGAAAAIPESAIPPDLDTKQPRIVVVPEGRLLLAARALPPRHVEVGPPDAGPAPLAVAGVLLSGSLDRAARGAVEAHQLYQQRQEERTDVKAASILLFLTITLLVLFAAVWVGLYVGRRLTTPIQALVESTRRVSEGERGEGAKVDVPADGELRGLVRSWNDMVGRLSGNEKLLRESNAELSAANETLETGRRFVRAILESATTAILALDAEGRIEVANRAGAMLLGNDDPNSLSGLRLDELPDSPAAAALADLLVAVRERSLTEPVRELNLPRGNETRIFEARLAPLRRESEGEAAGWVVAVEDVTPVVAAQRSAAWQEVAQRMAHEVKNPLTPIRLSAERMRRKLDEGNGEKLAAVIRDGTETIIESVGTLANLVDEFSRFSRLPRFTPAPTDVDAVVRRTVALYESVKPGVRVSAEPGLTGTPANVDADGLRRVLINLLDNALEATDDGGSVLVRTAAEDGLLRIVVEDTGRGIPVADRERIFQPYFSTKGRGTGLGLALSRRIVTDHGGSIRAEERSGGGTRFVVELPNG